MHHERIDWRKQWDEHTKRTMKITDSSQTMMPSYTEEPKWYACMRMRVYSVLLVNCYLFSTIYSIYLFCLSLFALSLSAALPILSIVGWPIQTNSQSTFSICFYSLSMFIVNDATHISKSPWWTRWDREMQANTKHRRWRQKNRKYKKKIEKCHTIGPIANAR